MTWCCPWCLARRVVKLHGRLQRTVLDNPAGKHLILLRASLPVNRFPLGMDDGHLRRADIDSVRRYFGEKLRALAAKLGIEGGLLTYQVGPAIADVGEHLSEQVESFRHQLNLLGEVEFRSDRHRQEVYTKLGIGDPDANWIVMWQSREVCWTIDSVVMPADDPQTLRILLAGSAARYQPRFPVDVAGTRLFREKSVRDGIPGAFAMEPLFMLDRARWYDYMMATRGLRMYDTFGSWREALKDDDGDEPILTGKERIMRKLNITKQVAATARRRTLLAVAQPLWNQVMKSTPSGRGRPAHRRRLADSLRDAGLDISMRDLKWLVKELK